MLKINNQTLKELDIKENNIKSLFYKGRNVFRKVVGKSQSDVVLNITFDANGHIILEGKGKERDTYIYGYHGVPTGNDKFPFSGQKGNDSNTSFSIFYDADDIVGQTLAGNHTIEILFCSTNWRGIGNGSNTSAAQFTGKIWSTQQSGGESIMYYPSKNKNNNGLRFQYVTHNDDFQGISSTTTDHQDLLGTCIYYHLVASVDWNNRKISLYKNGELLSQVDLNGEQFLFPNCGEIRREKKMWINIGSDPYATDNPVGYTESNIPVHCVFANLYDSVKSPEQVKLLYNDDVRFFTEITSPDYYNILLPDSLSYPQKLKLFSGGEVYKNGGYTVHFKGKINWDNLIGFGAPKSVISFFHNSTYCYGWNVVIDATKLAGIIYFKQCVNGILPTTQFGGTNGYACELDFVEEHDQDATYELEVRVLREYFEDDGFGKIYWDLDFYKYDENGNKNLIGHQELQSRKFEFPFLPMPPRPYELDGRYESDFITPEILEIVKI